AGAVARGALIRLYGGARQSRGSPVTIQPSKAAQAAGSTAKSTDTGKLERPQKLTPQNAPGFGSDVVAETLRTLDIPYIALNPGASYRGLHDSIVNYLGNETPQMLLCLHEESAVAIA